MALIKIGLDFIIDKITIGLDFIIDKIKIGLDFIISKVKIPKRKNFGAFILAVCGILLYVTLLVGIPSLWVMNVYKLTQCNFEAPYKAEIIYGVGTFSPTFLVTGFVDIDD